MNLIQWISYIVITGDNLSIKVCLKKIFFFSISQGYEFFSYFWILDLILMNLIKNSYWWLDLLFVTNHKKKKKKLRWPFDTFRTNENTEYYLPLSGHPIGCYSWQDEILRARPNYFLVDLWNWIFFYHKSPVNKVSK